MQPPPAPTPTPPPFARLHVWQIQAVRDVLVILAIIALIWAGYAMRAVTVPLLMALLLAYLFEPLVSWLAVRLRISRPLAVGGILLSIGLSVLILLAIVLPLVIGQTIRFVRDVRAGRFETAVVKLKEYVPEEYRGDVERALRWLTPSAAPDQIADSPLLERQDEPPAPPSPVAPELDDEARVRALVREEIAARETSEAPTRPVATWLGFARAGTEQVFDFLGAIVQLGLLAFLIPFYFFFFSVSFPAVVKFGREMVPVANRPRVFELAGRMDRAIAGFVRGRIMICLLMGVMFAVGWWIVGVPYSIVLGLVIGAFCIVPYLGGVGLPVAIGLLAFDQLQLPDGERMAWWAILFWPTLVFAIVQIIESYFLTPMIAGKATNLDPVTILVAVLAGGSVGGMYGMILAIPVAACLKILFTDVLLPKVRSWTRGESADPLPLSRA